jgi:16S rRNA (cytosine967-C5)-methyltransferase
LIDNRIDFYREWVRLDKGNSTVLFPPDLSTSTNNKGKGKLYRQLWYSFEGGARFFDEHLKKGWHKTPRRWRMILSLAFSEIIWLTNDTTYAAVNEWVEIAKKETGAISSKVINANLRSLIRKLDKKEWSLNESLPEQLIKIWQRRSVEESELINILRKGNHLFWHKIDDVQVVENDQNNTIRKWENGECIQLEQGKDPSDYLLSETSGFYQNITAAKIATKVAELVNDNESILDFCAAPGGKSWQMAKLLKNNQIYMYECSPKRVKMIEANEILSKFDNIQLLNTEDLEKTSFDHILIDVPCSNSGVLTKSPEAIRHFWIPDDSFVAIQKEIIEKALDLLGKNGMLFYSTCSINTRENSARVENFIQERGGQLCFEQQWYPTITGDHGGYLACIKM